MNSHLGGLQERRLAEYGELVAQFIKEISNLNLQGIEEPHLPVIGNCYERSRFKVAFCGMETLGWGAISEFVKKDANELVTYADYTINDLHYLGWPKNYHATFWGFVLKFLARFYNVEFKDLIEEKYPEVLRCFLWANTNSIERYEVSAQKQGADYECWRKVKEASLPFDNLNHLLRVANPKVVFILFSGARQEFFLDSNTLTYGLDVTNKNDYLRIDNKDFGYRYFFRRDTGTHIFCLPHPTYMGAYSGKSIDAYVDNLITDIRNYRIWPNMPSEQKEWFESKDIYINKCSIQYKREFIAKLSRFLIDNNSVMSGKELQELFNRNGIKTNSGYEYSTNGGQGIHRLISNVWAYYHGKQDFQTAYNIARAFVNQNGEYAYDL